MHIYVLTIFFVVLVPNANLFFVLLPSGFRGLAHEPHVPTTRTFFILPHQRPSPVSSVPTGGPLTPSDVTAPTAAAAAAAAACRYLVLH